MRRNLFATAACLISNLILLVISASTVDARRFTVYSWNVASGGSLLKKVQERVKEFQSTDVIIGLSEVQNEEWAKELAGKNHYVLGTTGGADRLVVIYDSRRFTLTKSEELLAMQLKKRARAGLVCYFKDQETDKDFIFCVNHLQRTHDETRHEQSNIFRDWVEKQSIGVIAVGDYNFDWEEGKRDKGYDLLTQKDILLWNKPKQIIPTQRGGKTLDFIFTNKVAYKWCVGVEVLVTDGEYEISDHRPLKGLFRD